jgi:hypothetical protein
VGYRAFGRDFALFPLLTVQSIVRAQVETICNVQQLNL